MDYRVRWEIDVEAETPKQAAQFAQDCLRDVNTMATVFEVIPHELRHVGVIVVDLKEDS